jgi:hypothetical protein
MAPQIFEQSIQINASATVVEQCITDRMLMHRWLNPALRCEPIGDWSTKLGSQSRFVIQIPVLQPALKSTVVEREPGLVVWQFEGFFQGKDPIVRFGFNAFAAQWTKDDMEAQLRRLKRVAEEVYQKSR